MADFALSRSELRFAEVLWDNEPVKSGKVVEICSEKFGWKKSTTYTVLKSLCEKGIFTNEKSIIISLVTRHEFLHNKARLFVDVYFGGSFSGFVASYRDGRAFSRDDIIELYNAAKKYSNE